MPYEFLVWLLAVLIQAAVLAINMHITLQFTDLENDNTNPHDAAFGDQRSGEGTLLGEFAAGCLPVNESVFCCTRIKLRS